jgi:putative component of membrane protein insertase Oxa1/YidC/SpoIIIJ protein YidD
METDALYLNRHKTSENVLQRIVRSRPFSHSGLHATPEKTLFEKLRSVASPVNNHPHGAHQDLEIGQK